MRLQEFWSRLDGQFGSMRAHSVARDHVFAALGDGILKPNVRRRYPLAAAADAHRDLEARRTSGQILLLA